MLLRSCASIASVAGILLVLPLAASADTLFGVSQPFTLSLSPQHPLPYSTVSVVPVSAQVDVTSGTVTVSVNGKQAVSGGAGSTNILLGAPGVPVSVLVKLATGGGTYTESMTITPQDVVLVAEPLSSAPPLYAGKPLVPLGGSIRMVAAADMRTPTGKRLDPGTLAYLWSVDGVEQQASSGIGKKTLIVDSPLQYRSRSVSVTVTSSDRTLAGEASFDVVAVDPSIRIYERDPLLGIRFERALVSSYAIHGAESTLYAGAFSFPTALGSPVIAWFLNGISAQQGSFITLRPTGAGTGSAALSVTGSSGGVVAASASIPVAFGSSRSSFFGL